MNKFCFLLFCVISFNLAAQLPHGFSLRENKDRAFQGTYETDVRKLGKHLCFETNILLIKDEKGVFRMETPLPEGLVAHPIVPNLYIYASKSSTFDDLKKEKEAIAKNLFFEDYSGKTLRTERAPISNSVFHTNKIIDKFLATKGKNTWSSAKGTSEGEKLYQDIINIQKNNPDNNKAVLDFIQKNYPEFDPIDIHIIYI